MACLRENFEGGVVLDGRYRTVAPLNHGSFGMVFMARQIATGNNVAIKCLTKKAAADEAGFDFAIDDKSEELVLHRHLGRHPNIVNLVESFETESHVYLVLEFCPRGDLYEAIRNGQGPLETEHVRHFMLELVDAVDYIHSKGIYHRDIKPENIFLSQSGTMKLGDFGLATTEKWTYETTVGSDRYMSPEQYDAAGAGYSPAQADIWAIGICMLNILFSRNPFTAPTEADPIFLDYTRDKQSLFDVFPNMSQDTYEVIVQCMNLDPKKRSLAGVRNALRRVVSFTTLDEALDDFCSVDHRVVASANREPLRTPSIQSPQVEFGAAFPWAKALQTSAPQAIRQLSVIPDNESYTEELFSKSEATTADWCSNMTGETPSMASVLDSSLGASMNSLTVSQPKMIPQPKFSKVSPTAGSLPITMPHARNVPSMSLVFGRKDAVSKSWSDMWDEDAEEEEERLHQLESLKKLNARTWSQDSMQDAKVADKPTNKLNMLVDDDNTPRLGLSPATKTLAVEIPATADQQSVPAADVHDDLDDDVLFFSDPPVVEKQELEQQRHDLSSFLGQHRDDRHHQIHLSVRLPHPSASPLPGPSKSPFAFDKWEALGERRRACTGPSATLESKSQEMALPLRAGQQFGNSLGYNFNSSYGQGVSDHFGATPQMGHNNNNNNNNSSFNPHYVISHSYSNGQNKHNAGKENIKDRVKDKECPWNKGRDWNWNWRRDRRADFGDVEWVGGW